MSKKQVTISQLSREDTARFWAKVISSSEGGAAKLVHGRFTIGGQTFYAHRVAFALAYGDSADSSFDPSSATARTPNYFLAGDSQSVTV